MHANLLCSRCKLARGRACPPPYDIIELNRDFNFAQVQLRTYVNMYVCTHKQTVYYVGQTLPGMNFIHYNPSGWLTRTTASQSAETQSYPETHSFIYETVNSSFDLHRSGNKYRLVVVFLSLRLFVLCSWLKTCTVCTYSRMCTSPRRIFH